jgi:hypothetical protein
VDIVAFLTARLDEDQAAVEDLSSIDRGPWRVSEWYNGEFDKDGRTEQADLSSRTGFITSGGALPRPVATHIARHDPVRVLREVVAKQRVMERHYPVPASDINWISCGYCVKRTWPCPDLRDLAAPYAGHPDYDESWRP